jgi:hypothetical protein
MPRTLLALFALALFAGSAAAQDVLSLGTGEAPSGGVVSIPVSILDRSGTSLGSDAGGGNRIQGIAFKVLHKPEQVQSATFTRGGVTAGLTPMFETSLVGTGFFSYVVSFAETVSPIAFTPNVPAPGNSIGTLNVTLAANVAPGTVILLTLDPQSAILSNQSSTVRETVAAGNLAVVNGTVMVNSALGAPGNLVATAAGTTSVNLTWSGIAGATYYAVYRSSNGAELTFLSASNPTSFSDSTVAAGTTYLYRVRAVDSGGAISPYSNVDAATTIVFTDDPLVAGATPVKAVHISELRTAVSALRAAAALAPLPADTTVAVGSVVRAQHINDLRAALNEARTTVGLAALTYTDAITAGTTPIRATHIHELRTGVK